MKQQKTPSIKTKNLIKIIIVLLLAFVFFAFLRQPEEPAEKDTVSVLEAAREIGKTGESQEIAKIDVTEDGIYGDPTCVALYLHRYGHLPSNYITKTQAKKKGWDQDSGNLWEVLPGVSIGGGPFANAEKKLPEKDGREYRECDVNYRGGARGGERIVYSNDGLVYFTADHYNTFKLLYGEP